MLDQTGKYIGEELTLFEHAVNWKKYWSGSVKQYLKGKVLEAGAGIGTTTKYLCDGSQEKWICLEPDPALGENIKKLIAEKKLPACCTYVQGTTEALDKNELFNAAVYIDVIEHIEKDVEELKRVSELLMPDGHLIILVPAHQFLYSPFDKSIGHFRRYSRKELVGKIPSSLKIKKAVYLDSVGLLSSSANKMLLKQTYPTKNQILFWDRVLVKTSTILDRVFFFNLGKSVLLVAQKTA